MVHSAALSQESILDAILEVESGIHQIFNTKIKLTKNNNQVGV
jgi:hypothetical protein